MNCYTVNLLDISPGDTGLFMWAVWSADGGGYVHSGVAEKSSLPRDQHCSGLYAAWVLWAGSKYFWCGGCCSSHVRLVHRAAVNTTVVVQSAGQ